MVGLDSRVIWFQMADLPACRLTEAAPFTHCGVDIFAQFIVKQTRSEVKRYGAVYLYGK